MKIKKVIIISSIIVVVAIGLWLLLSKSSKQSLSLATVEVKRGDIVNTVTATGKVEPIDQVNVGTQVSGVIKKIYVDFNSIVKKGQLLAELDKSTLNSQVLQSKASLASAQNEFTYKEQNYNRIKKLFEGSLVSEVDFEEAQYQYNNAKTSVERLKSNLDQAEVNLSYAMIYSPIDGVILNNAIKEGQTVAASFSTPTLFSIARDLTKMQVEANVDEADIGQVKLNQRVNFTVDAYPEDTFPGKVTQIRLEPTTTSNVVTYTVIIEAPNPDLKLMPGLTASIEVIIKESKNTFLVTPKALQFEPTEELATVYTIEKFPEPGRGEKGKPSPDPVIKPNENMGMPPMGDAPQSFGPKPKNMKIIWVKSKTSIHPRMVETGMEDGAKVEIVRGINEGDSVITAITKTQSTRSKLNQVGSPFMPKPPQRNTQKKSS
jgi:HlyD family secretion protein